MKPFNLEAAKAGEKVVTKGGANVRIIHYRCAGDYPIQALLTYPDGSTDICGYTINGSKNTQRSSLFDLHMEE